MDWGQDSGTVNSWSLIIQPASGSNAVAGHAMPVSPTAPLVALHPAIQLPPQTVGNSASENPVRALPAAPAANLVVAQPIVVQQGAGLLAPSASYVHTSNPVSIGGADMFFNALGGEVVM